MNLEPFLEADDDFNEDDFVANVWIAQTYDGARWGLPWDSGPMLTSAITRTCSTPPAFPTPTRPCGSHGTSGSNWASS